MMLHKKKRKLETPDENWLVSYSDLMTLLLYIFVILYVMSVANNGKVAQTLNSLYKSFGSSVSGLFNTSNIGSVPISGMQSVMGGYDQVNKYVKDNKLQGKVNVKKEKNGVSLELQDEVLFDPGSANIKSDNLEVLGKISELLKKLSNNIIIEGYTDNQPINKGYYKSNWELSSDRAVKVLRYFVDEQGLKPERFQAVGYGQYKPIASNSTAEGRQKNRRVNIVIVANDEDK